VTPNGERGKNRGHRCFPFHLLSARWFASRVPVSNYFSYLRRSINPQNSFGSTNAVAWYFELNLALLICCYRSLVGWMQSGGESLGVFCPSARTSPRAELLGWLSAGPEILYDLGRLSEKYFCA